jgi:hypothetical protein
MKFCVFIISDYGQSPQTQHASNMPVVSAVSLAIRRILLMQLNTFNVITLFRRIHPLFRVKMALNILQWHTFRITAIVQKNCSEFIAAEACWTDSVRGNSLYIPGYKFAVLAASILLVSCSGIPEPWKWNLHVLLEHPFTFSGLYGISITIMDISIPVFYLKQSFWDRILSPS